ncbi:4654_t:CDS:2, partial [Paraglomus brasilianum]
MSSLNSETDGLIDALLQSSTKSPEEITEVLGVLSVALDGPRGPQVTQAVLSAVPLPNFFTFLESPSESVINAAGIVLENNDTLKFRVIDLLSRIANISDEAFHLCESSGALYSVVPIFHSNDILLRLNAVESFIQVAETPTGYLFLKRTRIIESLIDMLALDENDVVSVLLKCGAIKFFGRVEAIEFEELARTHELIPIAG